MYVWTEFGCCGPWRFHRGHATYDHQPDVQDALVLVDVLAFEACFCVLTRLGDLCQMGGLNVALY